MNVFSFCLYGAYNPLYYDGLVENIHLIHKHFPGWGIFIYFGADVDAQTVDVFRSAPRVFLRFTGELGAVNMVHRFFAIDEQGVELMMVRDADSRVHWRDRWAIREFEKSTAFVAHAIRDSYVHRVTLLGGLWGLRKSSGLHIRTLYEEFKANPDSAKLGHDQDFLAFGVLPHIKGNILAHVGNNAPYDSKETHIEFPFPPQDNFYCGKVESPGFVDIPPPRSYGSIHPNVLKLSR